MIDNSQLASLTLLLAQTLDARGLDSRALLHAAGIDAATLRQPEARLRLEQVDRLWQLALDASGYDLGMAIDHAQRFTPANLHVLGFGLYASATLIEASQRIARAMRILARATRVLCTSHGDRFQVAIESIHPAARGPRQIVFHAVLLGLWRNLAGQPLAPLEVCLVDLPAPDAAVQARLEGFFGCPVRFGQRVSKMTLAIDLARAPLPMANEELAQRGDTVVEAYLATMDRSEIASAVINRIAQGSFDKAGVARNLGMGAASLQRRLAEQGLNFTQLLNETRRGLAADYLRSGRYTVKEVGYMLGYADTANFCRAFRAWYNCKPQAFRGA